MACDVLRWHAAGAFAESGFIASLFVCGKRALGMREEIGAITAKGEHEQQLRIQTRRWNVVCS
jgi:hypothetical protein